jgi:hypothetical protein
MDRAERDFKIFLDIFFTTILSITLANWFAFPSSIIISFLIAHTFNWLFNGHIFVIGRFVGFTSNSPERILIYTLRLQARIQEKKYLKGGIVIGNVVRGGEVRTNSDVDIRIVRRKGFLNGILASFFGTMERTKAFFSKFPLDLYIHDDLSSLDKLRTDEQPFIVFDPDDVLNTQYQERGYSLLEEWKICGQK